MLNESQYANSTNYDARIYINKKFKTNPQSKFAWIFGHFPRKEEQRVLELGCGTGLFWLANRNAIPASWEITLSDYSAGMLEGTRNSLSRIKGNFQYAVVNAEDIAFPDKQFDIVLANNMLYHVENRPAALAHIHRILKDDGVFVASTMGNRDMQELDQLLYDFLSSRQRSFRFREKPFSMDNGLAQLQAFFPSVTVARFDDMLRVDEVEAIINYYLSFNGMYQGVTVLPGEDVPAFRTYLQQIIDARQAISVTKDSGLFLCSK